MATCLNRLLRWPINRKNRGALHARSVSVLSSNCNGACICHDLGLPFQSPFVNLWLTPADFIEFLRRPREYLAQPLVFFTQDGVGCPAARLGGLTIWFAHYTSEEEAAAAWSRRAARIQWDALYVLMTDRDGCTYEDLRAFDALPYEHKAVFTHCPYPEIRSAVYIPGFEAAPCVGVCSEYQNGHTGRKWYDAFDYVAWLNGGT